MELSKTQANVIRRWYEALLDVCPGYMRVYDVTLCAKLHDYVFNDNDFTEPTELW